MLETAESETAENEAIPAPAAQPGRNRWQGWAEPEAALLAGQKMSRRRTGGRCTDFNEARRAAVWQLVMAAEHP